MTAKPKKPQGGTPEISPELNLTDLTNLATWLEGTGLEEVEVETLEYRVRLKKPSITLGGVMPMAAAPAAPVATPSAPAKAADDMAKAFKSPMVGTFYRASSPDAAPFMKEGDVVSAGQPIGIIEAMKTMNQITADRAGTITKILAANGQPVEFGQPICVIE